MFFVERIQESLQVIYFLSIFALNKINEDNEKNTAISCAIAGFCRV